VISGCQNSRRGIAAREGKTPEDIVQLPGVIDTPSGIVRVAELQEQGWSYVRP
jgi:intracellular sulfur oxidation DsrE/DsrF family protein